MALPEDRLVVCGLTQRFGDRLALDDVGVDIRPGRVTGLLGPNGAGKTTLMRILFGVIEPDSGHITWRGRPVTPDDRRSWGYMPQERGLYVEMRVIDHLVWLARLHGIEAADAGRRARSLLDRLDLADRVRDNIRDLSGGMAQRVQLAAAMVHEPDLLVLDEPFAGLDPTAVDFLAGVVRDHVAAGRPLLFSSHQLDLVEELCETIVMIDRGRVVLNGDVHELRRQRTDRYLEVDTQVAPDVLRPDAGVIASSTPTRTRIQLAPGADAVAVLDAVRSAGQVSTFAVTAPRLSEMFLDAIADNRVTARPASEPQL